MSEPPPYQQDLSRPPDTLSLDILKDSFHRLILVDSATQSTYYKIHNSSSMRSVQVSRPSSEPHGGDMPIGHADFHTFSSDVDIQVGNTHGVMQRKGIFSRSSLVGGGPFSWTWESEAFGRNLTLLDDKGFKIAEFDSAAFSFSKRGVLVIRLPMGQGALDWVIVTAMAKMELVRRKKRGAAAAGAGGAAGY